MLARPDDPSLEVAHRLRLVGDGLHTVASTAERLHDGLGIVSANTVQLRERLDSVLRRLDGLGLVVESGEHAPRVPHAGVGSVRRRGQAVARIHTV